MSDKCQHRYSSWCPAFSTFGSYQGYHRVCYKCGHVEFKDKHPDA